MKRFRNRDGSGETAYRHIHEDVDRHGNVRVYFWRGKGHRKIRLRETPGTPAFHAAYDAAIAQETRKDAPLPAQPEGGTPSRRPPPLPGTWRWLCVQYLASAEFLGLGASTRAARRDILESTWDEPIAPGVKEAFGNMPVARMTFKAVRILRDRKHGLAEAANGRVKAMRQVFKWALANETDTASANPARDVAYLQSGSDGYHTWTVDEVRQYEARHPVGTKARLALALLLFTGVRRSDVVTLGRQMMRNGWLRFTEVKGRARKAKEREIPVLPELQEVIDATPSGHMTFLVTEFGKPFSAAGFGNKMREWCDKADLLRCSAHGLRKAGATIAAENGATSHQLMAIFGWETLKQAELYTRRANRKRLVGAAMHLLVPGDEPDESGTNFPTFPADDIPVGKSGQKT